MIANSSPRIVAAMLAVAAALAFVMAVLAPINQRPELWRGPPDEYGHRSSARYYMDHWLPPRVGDAATLDSYSRDYGFSYLNDTDPVYLFAGKFAALASALGLENHDLAFRLFNVFLLAVLAAFCWLRPAAYLIFVPLLLSPQVWYICSYFNNDAFPLFLAVLIAYQVAHGESAFNRFLDAPSLRANWSGALLFGVLVALFALSKKNYMSFLALVPAVVALSRLGLTSAVLVAGSALAGAAWYLQWFQLDRLALIGIASAATLAVAIAMFARESTRRRRGLVLAKLCIMAAVAAAIVAPRFWWDAAIHGSLAQKSIAISKVQEQIAKPQYKPSVIYQNKPHSYYGIELRARGTPLSELFAPQWAWHSKTFATATGSYGWIEFTASIHYYGAMLAGYLALLAVYAWGVARSRDPSVAVSFVLTAAFCALTVGVALFHSWNNDFQAQGRYLFPIIAILGAGLHMARGWIPTKAMLAVVAFCFALSVYSFVFIGLTHVPNSF